MTEDRGQAITFEYTMGIGIAVVLVTGLLIAGGGFISDQRSSAGRAELQVIGQQIAADVEAADRLIASTKDADPTVQIRRRLPRDVAGGHYQIELVEAADPYISLASTDPDLTVSVDFVNHTAVRESSIAGGPVLIEYTSGGRLTIEPGDPS